MRTVVQSLLLVTAVVQLAQAQSAVDPAKDEAAIREVFAGLERAWTAGNGDAWASAFAEDADFTVWFGLPLVGRAEIAFGHNLIFRDFYANTTFHLEVRKVRFLGPAAAVVHLAGRVTRAGEARPPEPDAVPVAVLVRSGNGWEIVAFQNTPYAVEEFRANGDLQRFKRLAREQAGQN